MIGGPGPGLSRRIQPPSAISIFATWQITYAPYVSDYSRYLPVRTRTATTYVMIPWTAINLIDFYIIKRGKHSLTDIFNPAGIYHRFDWKTIAVYLVSCN